MAITTLAGITAGLRPPMDFAKPNTNANVSAVSATLMVGGTNWYASGNPTASSATSVGIDGEAVTPALGASVAGRLAHTNPVSGNAYLTGVANFHVGSGGTQGEAGFMLIDRLWQNSGIDITSTSAQAITPATLPARDINAATDGDGVMAALEWSANGGAGTPTVTLTYTNQDGTASRTGAYPGLASPGLGLFEIFPLDAGDTGIRAPTSIQLSATRTSGTAHLVLFRPLALITIAGVANNNSQPSVADAIQLAMPRIYDDSVLQIVRLWAFAGNLSANGYCLESHG